MSIEKLRNGRYRVRWRDETGRQRAKNFPYKDLARDFAGRLTSRTVEPSEAPRASSPVFAEMAERWLAEYCDVVKSPGERLKDRQRLRLYLLPDLGQIRVAELTLAHGTAVRAALAMRLKPSTVNGAVKLARKIMADAVDWSVVPRNPFEKLKQLPTHEQPFDYWLAHERDRFLNYTRKSRREMHELVAVAVHTGLRLGELLGLRWDAVDFARGVVVVRRSFCLHTKTLRQYTKTRRVREVPMNQVVLEVMKRRQGISKAGDQPVFELAWPHCASQKLKRLCRRVGVKAIRFHDLRHTFASLMAMAGVDLVVLKELLGHSNYAQTLRYAHLHPSRLTGATDRLCAQQVYSGAQTERNIAILKA